MSATTCPIPPPHLSGQKATWVGWTYCGSRAGGPPRYSRLHIAETPDRALCGKAIPAFAFATTKNTGKPCSKCQGLHTGDRLTADLPTYRKNRRAGLRAAGKCVACAEPNDRAADGRATCSDCAHYAKLQRS